METKTYIRTPKYGLAWELAIQVQALGISGPWTPSWADLFLLENGAVVGYDPVALQRVAGSRLAELKRVGGQLSYGGVALTQEQQVGVVGLWDQIGSVAMAGQEAIAPTEQSLFSKAGSVGAMAIVGIGIMILVLWRS